MSRSRRRFKSIPLYPPPHPHDIPTHRHAASVRTVRTSDRVAKILEGGFSGGKHPPKPPSCALPEYRDGWDEVIKRMTHHHGAAAIRSWFSNSTITTATQTPDGVMLTLEVRSEFLRGWIEKNYLTDLNHSWGEVICSRPVIGVELKTKEAKA